MKYMQIITLVAISICSVSLAYVNRLTSSSSSSLYPSSTSSPSSLLWLFKVTPLYGRANSNSDGKQNKSILNKMRNRIIAKKDTTNTIAATGSDDDNNDNDTVNIDEDKLKEMWVLSKRNINDYTPEAAVLELLDDDNDDDIDNGDVICIQKFTDINNMNKKKTAKSTKILKTSKPNVIATSNSNSNSNSNGNGSSTDDVVIPSGRSIGIDLGTTYSAVSIVEGGFPTIITVDNLRTVPSIVAYLENGAVIIGENARRQQISNPKNTFSSVKRVIGRSMKDVKSLGGMLNINLENGKEGALIRCNRLKRTLEPAEISCEILKALKKRAEEHIKEPVTKAVITVPAYFLPSQCQATEKAGLLAGFKKVKLLREPEAAALAYGLSTKDPQIILVFDLGGGTFDVSVLEVGGGFVEVIATSGDSFLGGDDFTQVIYDYIMDNLKTKDNSIAIKVNSDPIAKNRVLEAAETAKRRLSTEIAINITIPFLYNDYELNVELTRGRFEKMSKSLYARMLKPVREVAVMAGINLPGESGKAGLTDDFFDEYEDIYDEVKSSKGDTNTNINDNISISQLKKTQTEGRKEAKMRQKLRSTTGTELKRLKRELGDPSIQIFPGGQELNEVLIVGGATRMPAIVRLVRLVFGINPKFTVNPDEAISLGAAVLAGILDGEIEGMQVMSAWQSALARAKLELLSMQSKKPNDDDDDNDDDDNDDDNDDNDENKNDDFDFDENDSTIPQWMMETTSPSTTASTAPSPSPSSTVASSSSSSSRQSILRRKRFPQLQIPEYIIDGLRGR